MHRNFLIMLITVAVAVLASCCHTYTGYGRYNMKTCDRVVLDANTYELTRTGSDFVVEGHTIPRGIYRKTSPWLYTHSIGADRIEITFDTGSKEIYPLYTGSTASIFDVYAHPWEMGQSTNALFEGNKWLVSHRWNGDGIFFDLQQMGPSETAWTLLRPDIFVPADGTEVPVPEISTKVKIASFDAAGRKAMVIFSRM